MTRIERTILGIDPGLANTGWGIVEQRGPRLACTAYGCVSTPKELPLAQRLRKIHEQMAAVIARFQPWCLLLPSATISPSARRRCLKCWWRG